MYIYTYEPVDGAAVDQRREHAEAAAEGVPYGRPVHGNSFSVGM